MDPNRPNLSAGQRLKAVRERLGLSTRDVQRKSEQIAQEKHNQEYYLSHAWLTDVEQGKFMVGLFKLYSISAIYDKSFTEIASYFGLRFADLSRDRALIGVPKRISSIAWATQRARACHSRSNSSPSFASRPPAFWRGSSKSGTKCPLGCCNTLICVSPCMATLDLRIRLCIR